MIGELLMFPVHVDKGGALVAQGKGEDFPSEIQRVYCIRDCGEFLRNVGKGA